MEQHIGGRYWKDSPLGVPSAECLDRPAPHVSMLDMNEVLIELSFTIRDQNVF